MLTLPVAQFSGSRSSGHLLSPRQLGVLKASRAGPQGRSVLGAYGAEPASSGSRLQPCNDHQIFGCSEGGEWPHSRLVSRQGRDHTRRCTIQGLRARSLVLEVTRYDKQLVSRFEWPRTDSCDE